MLSLEDARELMTKYDIGGNAGKFSYREFLRHFILTLKPQDEGLLKRRKIHAARLPVSSSCNVKNDLSITPNMTGNLFRSIELRNSKRINLK